MFISRKSCLVLLSTAFLLLLIVPTYAWAFGNNLDATITDKNIVANYNGAGEVGITVDIKVDKYFNLGVGEDFVTKTGTINLYRIPYAAYSPGDRYNPPSFDASKATIVNTWQIQNYDKGTYALQYQDAPPETGQYIYCASGTDMAYGTYSPAVDVDVVAETPPPGNGNTPGNVININNTSFSDGWWNIVMQWYDTLVTLSGVFIFIVIIRSGYKYYHSSIDPSIRASLIMDVQRCFLAMLLIIITPYLIYMLIQINNGLVEAFKTITQNIQSSAGVNLSTGNTGDPTGFFDKIAAAPFQIVVDIFNKMFGLQPLDKLIFNISPSDNSLLVNSSGQSIFGNIQTDNVLATALLNLCMLGFNVYFNALYTIRYWVITAAFIGTPIIVWIWAYTEEKQVLEIWGSEIFSTIFMQTFHALTFGVFFSVAEASKSDNSAISLFVNTTKSVASTTAAGTAIQNLGLWFAGLGGALCAMALLNASVKMIVSRGQEKYIAEARESVSKAIIGVSILGLSMMIAGLLIYLFNGNW